jgi:hypothetical protein
LYTDLKVASGRIPAISAAKYPQLSALLMACLLVKLKNLGALSRLDLYR